MCKRRPIQPVRALKDGLRGTPLLSSQSQSPANGIAVPEFRRINAWTVFWTLAALAFGLLVLDLGEVFGEKRKVIAQMAVASAFAAAGAALLHALRLSRATSAAEIAAERNLVADVMDSVPDGLALWAADGSLTTCNAAFSRNRFLSGEGDQKRSFRDFVADSIAQSGLTGDAAKAFVDARMAAFAAADGKPYERTKLDGSIEEIRFYRARNGGVLGVYCDVTELKRRAAELQRQRAEFAEIIDAIPDGLMLWDAEGRLTARNKAAANVRAGVDATPIGTRFEDFARAGAYSGKILEANGREEAFLESVLAEFAFPPGTSREVERTDGRWYEVRRFRTSNGGVVTTYRDITERKLVEKRLEIERGRLQDIMDAIPDTIAMWDKDLRLIAFNQNAGETRARTGRFEIGMTFDERTQALVEAGLATDGAERFAAKRRAAILDPTGEPTEESRPGGRIDEIRRFPSREGGVVVVARDVTERRAMVAELEKQRGRLADVMDAIADGITIWDADQRLVASNQAATRFRAGDAPLTPGIVYSDYISRLVAISPLGHDAEAGRDFVRARIAEHLEPTGVPVEFPRSDGTWEETRKFRTRDGGVVTLFRDITERKEAEAERERQRQVLQEIIDALPDGLQVWGVDGKLVAFNRIAKLQRAGTVPLAVGMSFAEYIRRTAYSGSIPGIKGSEETFIAVRLAEHAGSAARTREIARSDGRWEELRKVATSDGGRLSLFRDVTGAKKAQFEFQAQRDELERRLAERERLMAERDSAEAASRAKTEFLAMMSHELRTPMNGVIATTGLLARTRLGEKQRLYLDTVQRSAQALLTIIDDVLDWAKLEEGRIEIESVDCAPVQIADNVISLLRPAASQKGVDLTFEFGPALPEFGRLDPARLRQILLNLVGNAIKFTAAGRVSVRLTAEPLVEGHLLTLEIEDTGIGIAPESLPKLFTRFTQADGTIARRYGGTGLGLAIVKRLLDLMGGTIDVSSRPGEGSRFVVRLPMAKGGRPVGTAAPLLAAPARPLKLLVAEDNAINRMVVEHLLRELGHSAEFAHDGAEAVTKARDGDHDAILMDVQMPDTDGIQATRLIRAFDGPRARVPIVALTANAMAGDRERYLEAGMDDYVSKPIDAYELAAALARATGGPGPAPGTAQEKAASPAHEAGRAALAGLVEALKRASAESD